VEKIGMCGIVGCIDLQGGPPDERSISRVVDTLSHRGPDSFGVRVLSYEPGNPTVIVGCRRLAIIDLSPAGGQPLPNEDGSVAVVHNGEIYNFRELRRDLEGRGHVFRSGSDTEVIVHAYEVYGEDFVSRLDGMFAFALWDGKSRSLLLARDRVGKKPLYYSWDGRRLTFASEIKALRACPWVKDAVDWSRIPELLALGYVAWPRTLFQGIRQLPPASTVKVGMNGPSEPRPYWELRLAREDTQNPGWAKAADDVRELLREAVQRRLVADVPLGVLLSGGLDSSAIVAAMASLDVPVRTFTIGFGEDASYDERNFARLVARRFETHHTEVVVRADEAALLERIMWFLDQPFADSSVVPTYLIAQTAREHVTVALGGDGGDEVFGGYERFRAALLAQSIPGPIQSSMPGVARLLPRTGGYYELRSRLERFAGDVRTSPERRYRDWVAVFNESLLHRVLSPDVLREGSDPFASVDSMLAASGDLPLLHRLLHANFTTYLHDDLLVKTDRMTMANSLEARSPFLDTSLIEYVGSLPPQMKATTFGLKRLLKHAMRGRLPDAILRRRKHGFGVPVGRWFRQSLKGPFQELVLSPDARSAQVLDRTGVSSVFDEHIAGRADHGGRLWSLLSLELWLRMLEGPHRLEPPSSPEILVTEGPSL